MKTFKYISTLIVSILILSSCASVSVKSDYDSKTNFSQFKTFAFYKKGIDKTKISDLDKRRILRAIESELKTKEMAVSKSPDVLVSIYAKSTRQIDVHRNNNFWYPHYYGSQYWNNQVSRYTEGTLFIDLIDAKNKTLLWQGIGRGVLNTSGNVEKKEARINKFVAEILKQYPPNKD